MSKEEIVYWLAVVAGTANSSARLDAWAAINLIVTGESVDWLARDCDGYASTMRNRGDDGAERKFLMVANLLRAEQRRRLEAS